MIAICEKEDYPDLTPGYEYEIYRIYSDGHIRLKNSPRKYDSKCFIFMNKGKKITYAEAYRLHQIEKVKMRLGLSV